MSNILLILFPSQLFDDKIINKIINYNTKSKNLHIILWEHPYFFTKYKYHKLKLAFHRVTMKKFYDDLNKKYKKNYIEYNKKKDLDNYINKNSIDLIKFINPIEKELIKEIDNFKNVEYYPSPYFLLSCKSGTLEELNKNFNVIRHDSFYKNQRINFNIMVNKDNKPIGNKWSFDIENRSPFEKNQTEPPILRFNSNNRDKYIEEGIEYVKKNFSNHYGELEKKEFIYPIDHSETLKWLDHFIKFKIAKFGKYEDAFSSNIRFGYHSLMSMLTNSGLITPIQILNKVKNLKINLESKEGFIRQLIGWREYCYFTYDLYSKNFENNPFYNLNNNKIPLKVWQGNTLFPPIDNILKNVKLNAYSHHIERLMGIGNYLILIGVSQKEIFLWFQTMYIDAYHVFMYPNVYGMLCYGKLNEKSKMMTRPYFCSSNYLKKMSNFKSSEIIIDNKKYKWDDIFDSLYYNHINKYSDKLKSIYSSASSVNRWNKFDSKKKNEIFRLSKLYLNWIYK